MRKDWIARELTIEILVGVFMVMIFLGLGYFTIILSRERVFGPEYELRVLFQNVMGLREGDNVVVRGMPVGKVRSLELTPRGVHVVATLDEPVEMRDGYSIFIVSTSILGGRHLEVDEGPRGADVLADDEPFVGEEPRDLMNDAAELVAEIKRGLIEGGVIENLQNSARQLNEIVSRVNRGEGMVGRLLSEDETLYRELTETVASLKAVAQRLDRGEGTVGRLLADDALYRDLAETAEALKNVARRVERGEGTLGKLLAEDDAVYRDLSATVASLKNTAARLESGEGTLGRLVSDDSLYEEVEATVTELRAAVDDFRESAPITTFSSIFFGAF